MPENGQSQVPGSGGITANRCGERCTSGGQRMREGGISIKEKDLLIKGDKD